MSKKLQPVVESYSDYTHAKRVPVTREQCFDSIAKGLQTVAKAASQVKQNN